jgi:hypothetical protein
VKSISPDSRSTGSNSGQFMLTGQNQILSTQPSGIPPGQDISCYSRHLTPNEKITRLSGLYLYQDCLIIPPISSLFLCTLYNNSQVTLDIKLNLITQVKFTWPLLLSTYSLKKLDPRGDDVPPGISLRRYSHADRENPRIPAPPITTAPHPRETGRPQTYTLA